MNKKKLVGDVSLNLIASAVPIILLQLLILPLIASRLGDKEYGLAITLVSLFTLTSHSFGNVLNNIRLLQNKEYDERGYEGDFNFLLITCLIISTVLTTAGAVYYGKSLSLFDILLIVIITCFILLREYLIVSFRLILNYKAILVNNFILGIGYLAGLTLFYLIGIWQLVYLVGSVSSLLYIIKSTNLLKESYKRTPLFKPTLYKSTILFIAGFTGTVLSYADKLILYPLLGPTAVSIYYSATIIGKMISMGITPISGVMLSYLARMDKVKQKSFLLLLAGTFMIGIVGYFTCILISKPLLHLLYPAWAEESLKLIYITVATAVVGAMSSVIKPLVLRFNSINWQIVLSTVNLVIYLICAFIFYTLYGLLGFCIGILISAVINLFLLITIFLTNYRKVQP